MSINNDKIDNVANAMDNKFEKIRNKVTYLSSDCTDDEYPSAKCVYDLIQLCGYEINIASDKNILSAEDNESCTITAVLTKYGNVVADEELVYQLMHEDTVLDDGTVTTDANGEVSIQYTATDVGDVDVKFIFRSLLQKTYTFRDGYYSHVSEHTNTSDPAWDTIVTNLPRLPEDMELTLDLYSTNVTTGSEQRLYICPTSTFNGAGQPAEAVWVGFSNSNAAEYGYRHNDSSNWYKYTVPDMLNKYHSFKIIRHGSTWEYYVNDVLMGTKTYNIGVHDDYTICLVNWTNDSLFKFKNLRIKEL